MKNSYNINTIRLEHMTVPVDRHLVKVAGKANNDEDADGTYYNAE